MRLLLDQGLPFGAVIQLRSAGWDAVHVREIGMRDSPDAEILDFAGLDDRILITLDRDFPQILALTLARRPSVLFICQQGLRADSMASLIVSICDEHADELSKGCVVKVSARGTRIHPLPLA